MYEQDNLVLVVCLAALVAVGWILVRAVNAFNDRPRDVHGMYRK